MDKWVTFSAIDPMCWQQETTPGSAPIWSLKNEWIRQLFQDSSYTRIVQDGEPGQWRRVIVFTRSDGIIEITIYSPQNSNEYYDFTLSDNNAVSGKMISRGRAGAVVAPATVSASTGSTPGDLNVHISSPDIDEELDVNLRTLAMVIGETRREREQKLLPWKRLLTWYGRLQTLDPPTFSKVPAAIQRTLWGPMFGSVIETQTWQDFEAWQSQGVLPKELPWIFDYDVEPLRDAVVTQQQEANDPLRQADPFAPPRVPTLLMRVDAATLDWVDLQVFMTIGALREAHRYKERAFAELFKKRRDLEELSQTPQGWSVIYLDPAAQRITSHPLAKQEDDEELELYANRNTMVNQKARVVEQEVGMNIIGDFARSLGMQIPIFVTPGLVVGPAAPPLWKIYKPYLI
jgi:hypothetical protein